MIPRSHWRAFIKYFDIRTSAHFQRSSLKILVL